MEDEATNQGEAQKPRILSSRSMSPEFKVRCWKKRAEVKVINTQDETERSVRMHVT